MTPTTYGRDFAYCLKSHGGVRGFNASLWRFLLRCTLFCHSVATFLTSVSSYEGGCGFEVLGETILEWNDKNIEHYHARRMAMDSMLCRFKDDFIIGDVFALRENEDTYNVGWHFNKRFEGKGFACEAAAGLLDYLFREAGARRIYGFVEDDNIRSKRLCERLGMRREGCFKEFVTFVNNPDGSPKYEDTCVYAILEKEWNTIRQW